MRVWKVILAALVIFGAGVVTGGLTFQLDFFKTAQPDKKAQSPTRSKQRPELIDRLEKELGLSAQQRERIDKILRASRDRMKKLWESVSPKTDEEFKRLRTLILAELTPEQAEKYKELFKYFGNKRRHNDGDRNSNGSKKPDPSAVAENAE